MSCGLIISGIPIKIVPKDSYRATDEAMVVDLPLPLQRLLVIYLRYNRQKSSIQKIQWRGFFFLKNWGRANGEFKTI